MDTLMPKTCGRVLLGEWQKCGDVGEGFGVEGEVGGAWGGCWRVKRGRRKVGGG